MIIYGKKKRMKSIKFVKYFVILYRKQHVKPNGKLHTLPSGSIKPPAVAEFSSFLLY